MQKVLRTYNLRQFVKANKLKNVAIPEDGETVKF